MTSKSKRSGPPCAPPVWAETRQELAETLTYYRAYQSGSYVVGPYAPAPELKQAFLDQRSDKGEPGGATKDSTPYAYLLGGFPSARDAWADQGRVVISHGGGHAQTFEDSKEDAFTTDGQEPCAKTLIEHTNLLASSQSRNDPHMAALLASCREGIPVILIVGENYLLADFELNCGFAVLGWYDVTHCWAEREANDLVRWKVRFQWRSHQGRPWWTETPGTSAAVLNKFWNPRARLETSSANDQDLLTVASAKVARSSMGQSHRRLPARRKDLLKKLAERRRSRILTSPYKVAAPSASQVHNRIPTKECSHCRMSSPQIFESEWTCLVPECHAGFWHFSESHTSHAKRLEWLPQMLRSYAPDETEKTCVASTPFSVQPNPSLLPAASELNGFFCKRCNRVSCREYSAFHRCSHCGLTIIQSETSTVKKETLLEPLEETLLEDTFTNDNVDLEITQRYHSGCEIITYALPAEYLGSRIHLMISSPTEAQRPEERKDDVCASVLAALQHKLPTDGLNAKVPLEKQMDLWQDRLKLRRHELSMHRSTAGLHGNKARLLTQMYTANIGAAYKHSTQTETLPWSEAPEAMLAAGQLLSERTQWAVRSGHLQQSTSSSSNPKAAVQSNSLFNELYPCLYLNGMKMNYHDDGEPGLGPIVSSLSLGEVPASMKFRLKRKYTKDGGGKLAKDRDGTAEIPMRLRESEAFGASTPPNAALTANAGSGTIRQRYQRLQHELMSRRCGATASADRVVLSIPLRHGSIVVQEGHALQQLLEHTVVPQWESHRGASSGRLAITARWIDNEGSSGQTGS